MMYYYLLTMGISWCVCGAFNWLCAFVGAISDTSNTSRLLNEHPIKTLAYDLLVYIVLGVPYALILGPIPMLAGAFK